MQWLLPMFKDFRCSRSGPPKKKNLSYLPVVQKSWVRILTKPQLFVARILKEKNDLAVTEILCNLLITVKVANHGCPWVHACGSQRIVLSSECVTLSPDIESAAVCKDVVGRHVPEYLMWLWINSMEKV